MLHFISFINYILFISANSNYPLDPDEIQSLVILNNNTKNYKEAHKKLSVENFLTLSNVPGYWKFNAVTGDFSNYRRKKLLQCAPTSTPLYPPLLLPLMLSLSLLYHYSLHSLWNFLNFPTTHSMFGLMSSTYLVPLVAVLFVPFIASFLTLPYLLYTWLIQWDNLCR